MRRIVLSTYLMACLFGIALTGCESSNSPTDSQSKSDGRSHQAHDPTEGVSQGDDQSSELHAMTAGLNELSTEDRVRAEAQDICPVSGEKLGSMGAPIQVDVGNQQVWICCEGCQKPLLENPQEHLAKLKQRS